MELFNIDGHLTSEGIDELVLERLNELQRLEAAEHLSFCDECILKYTERLETAVLYENAPETLPKVKQILRKKLMRIAFSKYSTAAAAVALALIIGGTGIFSGGMSFVPKGNTASPQHNISYGLSFVTKAINGLFNQAPSVPKLGDVKIPKQKEINIPQADKASAPKSTDDKSKADTPPQNPAKAWAQPESNPAKDIAEKQNTAFDLLKPKPAKSN